MSDPVSLGLTMADEASAFARANAGAVAILAIGASRLSGPAAAIANFTAGTGGTVLGALSVVAPSLVGSPIAVGILTGSLTYTIADAKTVTVNAQQNNGGVASGGTTVGSFSYTSGAGTVVITGGSVQAGLGVTVASDVLAGTHTAALNGQIVAVPGTHIVIPVIFTINAATSNITNCVLSLACVFLA